MTESIGKDEKVSGKLLALFLTFGAVGAILMSWISYVALVGRAM